MTIKWTVAQATGIAGFQVYAGSTQLTQHTIPAHASRSYHFTTSLAPKGPYTLHMLMIDGTEQTHRFDEFASAGEAASLAAASPAG